MPRKYNNEYLIPPPLKASRGGGGQNLNREFKTFGFLDTIKVNIRT